MRFPFRQWKRNPLAEILRRYDVWGKRCESKALPNRPFSREFWIGALSGLIDTDGCVRERVNAKGTMHGSVEYATISRRLAQQVSDALLRLGVTNIIREKSPRSRLGSAIQARYPIFIVEVNRAAALTRLAQFLDLRIGHKAAKLASLAERLAHVTPPASEMHGYDPTVALDRIVAIEDAGERATYCVTVNTSSLFIANGIVTGNCLRNLRNFDETGVSDEVAATVAARLADPEQVARSRQLPFRFYAAFSAVGSLRWSHALEKALAASLSNIPSLGGRTLVLVDQSPSMFPGYGFSSPQQDQNISNADLARLFGVAVALRAADATLVEYGSTSQKVAFSKGDAVLRVMERFRPIDGTDTFGAAAAHFTRHDRVVIVTDEQNQPGRYSSINEVVPLHVPVYTWNIGGYAPGATPSGLGTRHTFGGLSDAAFRLIPLLESHGSASWPF
jgi:hypothetical protein